MFDDAGQAIRVMLASMLALLMLPLGVILWLEHTLLLQQAGRLALPPELTLILWFFPEVGALIALALLLTVPAFPVLAHRIRQSRRS